MENNFEKWRISARIVAIVDIGFLVAQVLYVGYLVYEYVKALLFGQFGIFLFFLSFVWIVPVSIIAGLLVTNYFAIICFFKATNKNTDARTARFWTLIWFFWNIFYLVIVIVVDVYFFESQFTWKSAVKCVILLIRLCMLGIVRVYLNALKELSAEPQVVSDISSPPEYNEIQADQV